MDLVGSMLYASLREHHRTRIDAELIRPKLPFATSVQPEMLSRLFGRFLHYPREVRRIAKEYDVFHIVDHSYAHLAHQLPADRTIVTCHDIDAFRCLVEPHSRSWAFRAMTRPILTGMLRAAHVTCDTEATRNELLAHRLLPAERMTVVHNGVHPALRPEGDATADEELSRILGRRPEATVEVLHVGSTIPRKRIDTLLKMIAEVRHYIPDIRLLRVGGELTGEQRALAQSLAVWSRIDNLPRLSESLLAAAYRRATVLVMPSESEGFGLPVVEGMACGTPVIASDIAPLSEIGGDAAIYCETGNQHQFATVLAELLKERELDPVSWAQRRKRCVTQSSQFSWPAYAARMIEIYNRVIP